MKYFSIIAAIALFGGSCTAQQFSATRNSNNEIVITRSENENDGAGNFKWLSELSDGTKIDQNGYVKAGPDPESPIQVIQGSYSYISPEGQNIVVQYIADENGFQPQGEHIPKLPAITRSADAGFAPQQPLQQRPQNRPISQQRPLPPPQRPIPQPPRRG